MTKEEIYMQKWWVIGLLFYGCTPLAQITRPIYTPAPVPAIERVNQELIDAGKGVFDTGKTLIEKGVNTVTQPEKPARNDERPRLKIVSDPSNLLSLSSFVAPATVLFEAQLENAGRTQPIVSWQWRILRLGIPLISDDEVIFNGEGPQIRFLFADPGRYRVTASVTTLDGEVSSQSVSLWARP
jgi:hypothetical protein